LIWINAAAHHLRHYPFNRAEQGKGQKMTGETLFTILSTGGFAVFIIALAYASTVTMKNS
jgi:hypothetical protein